MSLYHDQLFLLADGRYLGSIAGATIDLSMGYVEFVLDYKVAYSGLSDIERDAILIPDAVEVKIQSGMHGDDVRFNAKAIRFGDAGERLTVRFTLPVSARGELIARLGAEMR